MTTIAKPGGNIFSRIFKKKKKGTGDEEGGEIFLFLRVPLVTAKH